ncbi:efflux RND transporter permease subunit [Rhodovibrionaceae bacterium A322]
MISAFFINRPKFALVISTVIVIAGTMALRALPIEQYPDITPPVVSVSATYTGANSEVVESAVAQPLEEQVNGVDDMIYMESKSANDGSMSLNVSFEVGTNPDIAAVNTQNRASIATPRLPEDVKRVGVTVQKQSTQMLLIVNLTSPKSTYDALFLSNYASINIKDTLARLPGVGKASILGALDYGMRMWLDPQQLASLSMTVTDVVAAIQEQNVQVAAGQVGAAPSAPDQQFQYSLRTQGRFSDPEQFKRIIVRANPDGSVVRLADVARVDLGAQNYSSYGQLNSSPTTVLAVYQSPGANALDVSQEVRRTLAELSERFPEDVEYKILYDITNFVKASVDEVYETLFIAIALVIAVVFIFLGDWRSTLIPSIAVPVSLIGTFAALAALGFSINLITLFGLILAIGIVVDDAIIVVENVQVKLSEGLSPQKATYAAMEEVSSPVIATTLVLLAVFVPVAFMPGITGKLYQQFAVTISVSVMISSVNALTLSPALAVLLLKPPSENHFFLIKWFNKTFEKVLGGYMHGVRFLVRRAIIVLFLVGGMFGATYYGFINLPGGFLPTEDQGFIMVDVALPDAAALARTTKVVNEVEEILRSDPAVTDVISVGGYSLLSGSVSSSSAMEIAIMKPWEERQTPELKLDAVLGRLMGKFSQVREANVFAFVPPAIPGLGSTGGFEYKLQDRGGGTPQDLAAALRALLFSANQRPELQSVYSTYRADVPQIYLDVNRDKTKKLGVPLSDVFTTLQAQLGSLYVNDFDKFGRIFKVYVQADKEFRAEPEDVFQLYVRNEAGEMVPLSTLISTSPILGPESLTRFNMFRAATVNGSAAAGYSSGQAIKAMEEVSAEVLPPSFGFQWSGITLQEIKAGSQGPIIFALAILFVYLFLVAQYESWMLPLSVILAVPLAALGAITGLMYAGIPLDVYAQIGMVLLVGMATKNAILIVEFAKHRREEGMSLKDAAITAAHQRFRAIMMTAFSFILGVIPLVIASGAGAASRQSVGVTVFSGMLAATVVGTFLVPVFFLLIQSFVEKVTGKTLVKPKDGDDEDGAGGAKPAPQAGE